MRGIGGWFQRRGQRVLCSNHRPIWGGGGFERDGSVHQRGREGLCVCRSLGGGSQGGG